MAVAIMFGVTSIKEWNTDQGKAFRECYTMMMPEQETKEIQNDLDEFKNILESVGSIAAT